MDYIALNKANWDERAPEHAKAPEYEVQRLLEDCTALSNVVSFDRKNLGDINGLRVVHLQCHIGTDTLSLARLGAHAVVGLDFSPKSLEEARRIVSGTAEGKIVEFVESTVDDALSALPSSSFDLVYTGIGALCWLPSIERWAAVVSSLLRPGGRLFIREGHPCLWSIDERIKSDLVVRFPYFERESPMIWDEGTTYVNVSQGKGFENKRTVEWNHGIGEIISAVIGAGLEIRSFVEHQSVPWDALPGQMDKLEAGEYALREGRERLPLTYTLQATKPRGVSMEKHME
ncbi:hypothetical protein M433DRAFT_381221 [Acidomyces richmondensis BFW]|nr:MAG: hypothetical protein FE78DRAFT_521015 [Acidomyces sp. 'richmondensis']KYG42921.1 hypothetical protein M433DRAFT_381221 [Acidomyces richmondensis BFW]